VPCVQPMAIYRAPLIFIHGWFFVEILSAFLAQYVLSYVSMFFLA
jgi:hypothetical protein